MVNWKKHKYTLQRMDNNLTQKRLCRSANNVLFKLLNAAHYLHHLDYYHIFTT